MGVRKAELICTRFSKVVVNNTGSAKVKIVRLEKLDIATGETVEFDPGVLMVANGEDIKISAPVVEGVKIKAEVVSRSRR